MKRIALIGCSKQKHPYKPDRKRGGRLTPAELYSSQLFRARVKYAESRELPWFVLSAAFGLWPSHVEKNPRQPGTDEAYDVELRNQSPAERAAWCLDCASDVIGELWETDSIETEHVPIRPSQMIVEIHAGERYAHPLADVLLRLGVNVSLPCERMGIGEQLHFYSRMAKVLP